MLVNKPNQPSKFRAKNWVERNDKSRGTYSTGTQVKFKTSMLKSSLYDDCDVYILVSVSNKHNTPKCRCNNNNNNEK